MSGLGLVLSGGGARGAYEVGVLSYVFGDLVRAQGPIALDVVSGTSVGAVNAAFIAATTERSHLAIRHLESIWGELRLGDVLAFGLRQAISLPRALVGGRRAAGVFDARPLAAIVGRGIPWRGLARNLRRRALKALTISATNVRTGRPVVFIDRASQLQSPASLASHASVQRERITPSHILASAAIPIAFPPVAVGSDLFCDGGLRLNTPMAPAIHLGMDRLFVVGVSSPDHGERSLAPGRYPGAAFLLGKVLNAFLLDHLNSDIEEVERVNTFLLDGIAAFGPDFIERINEAAAQRGDPQRHLMRVQVVYPSLDLGSIASDFVHVHRRRFGRMLGASLLKLLEVGEGDADLASYLLFDGEFARALIDLGRRDAHRQRDALIEFFYGAPAS